MDYYQDYNGEYGGAGAGNSHSQFQQVYRCYPTQNPNLENGGKIIMPASALDQLSWLNINFPYMFSIRNPNSGKVSHCGVLEFTADEGSIVVPEWMMKNLQLDEGGLTTLSNVALETGTYFKLQPHATAFTELVNPKAVLENRLRNFSCLSCGDTIMVMHDETKYYIDIVETRPDRVAISILETDCEVDFAPPLDYKEPEIKPRDKVVVSKVEEPELEPEPKFMPFRGVARRLDGKPPTNAIKSDHNPSRSGVQETGKKETISAVSGSRKNKGKLVFGPGDHTRNWNQSEDQSCKGTTHDQIKEEEDGSKKLEQPKFQPFTGKKYSLMG